MSVKFGNAGKISKKSVIQRRGVRQLGRWDPVTLHGALHHTVGMKVRQCLRTDQYQMNQTPSRFTDRRPKGHTLFPPGFHGPRPSQANLKSLFQDSTRLRSGLHLRRGWRATKSTTTSSRSGGQPPSFTARTACRDAFGGSQRCRSRQKRKPRRRFDQRRFRARGSGKASSHQRVFNGVHPHPPRIGHATGAERLFQPLRSAVRRCQPALRSS